MLIALSRLSAIILAIQNSSIGDLVPCLLGRLGTTNNHSLLNNTEWPQRLATFESFDQSHQETWHDPPKMTMPKTKINKLTMTNTFREHLQRLIRIVWTLRYLIRVMRKRNLIKDKTQGQRQIQRPWQKHDMACELLLNYWPFRQLRTWLHDNHCDVIIKNQTG